MKLSREDRRELESLCLRELKRQGDADYADVLIEREVYRRAA